MKKLILSFSILMLSVSSFHSQEMVKTLINNDLEELFINKDNPFGSIPVKTIEKYYTECSKIYFFEIVYNGKVIFREGIRKTIPQSRDSETMSTQLRYTYNNIYLDASEISDGDKVKLLESYKNKIVDISGQKLVNLNEYQIIKKDYNKNQFVIMNPLDNMKINVYKIEFK